MPTRPFFTPRQGTTPLFVGLGTETRNINPALHHQRPLWKPMHKQPVYDGCATFTNGVEEALFKVGFCLPAGPWVTDEDVRYIVECLREAIE